LKTFTSKGFQRKKYMTAKLNGCAGATKKTQVWNAFLAIFTGVACGYEKPKFKFLKLSYGKQCWTVFSSF
jgi:hypothetical protein